MAAEQTTVAEIVTGIYRGQTHQLTRHVRALDHACELLATARLFDSPEQARDWALKRADRHARTDKET